MELGKGQGMDNWSQAIDLLRNKWPLAVSEGPIRETNI